MRIWLDDSRPMPEEFDSHVKTPWECIELLKTGKVETISLDNDFGLFNYVDPNEGRHVADFIEESARNGTLPEIPEIYIHTSDSEARRKMKLAVHNAYQHWQTQSGE